MSAIIHYFNQIKDNKILSLEEQQRANKEELIHTNLKLVVKIAHQYRGMGVELLDLIQEGNIGLLSAVDKYDPTLNIKFSTFASYYIKMKMRKYLDKNSTVIKESGSHKNHILKIHKYMTQYYKIHGVNPSITEIATKLNISEKKINNALRYKVTNVNSYDNVEEIFQNTTASVLPSDDLIRRDDDNHVTLLLNSLSERERLIIKERFFNNQTLQAIGDNLGISTTHVKNIQVESLKKMRLLC